jgi:2'-5' RNA ligase
LRREAIETNAKLEVLNFLFLGPGSAWFYNLLMRKTRTFIAVEANDAVYAAAVHLINVLRPFTSNVKWVEPDNLHWTLQFLGDLGDVEIAEVCRTVGRVAARHESFDLVARGVGAFPSIARPRTLWLAASDGAESLCALQDDLAEELAEMGFRGENRRFVPHLTLGRVGQGSHAGQNLADKLGDLADFEAGVMAVDQVTAFASQLERSGPVYHVLAHADLG